MNKEVIQGDVGKEIVEDSCGCVFCDLSLRPMKDAAGNYWHSLGRKNRRPTLCTNPKFNPKK